MAGNAIRCVAKYLYENGYVKDTTIRIETRSGIKTTHVISFNGKVNFASVDMGKVELEGKKIPCIWDEKRIINKRITINGNPYNVTLLNIGNPHAVVFCDKVDAVDVANVGPQFEYSEYFPERINVEFVRVVNRVTLKMRVWERGNGETWSCGTGAAAAAVAAILNGYCDMNEDITVKVIGGDLIVNCHSDWTVELKGNVKQVFEGRIEI